MIIKKKLKKLMQKDRYEIHVKKLTKKQSVTSQLGVLVFFEIPQIHWPY